MERQRVKRVAELVRQETADLLAKGVKDPRIGFVSVMSVDMSPDLKYADVYVSLYGTDAQRRRSLIGLRNSAGWLRKQVGARLRLRWTPELRFFEDDTLERTFRLDELFRAMHDQQQNQEDPEDGEG